MKKLLPMILLAVLLLPALPGGATSSPSPSPSPTTSPSPSPSPTTSPSPSPSPSATPSPSPSPTATPSPSPSPTATPTTVVVPAQTNTRQATNATLTYAGRGLTGGLTLTVNGQGLRTGLTTTRVANAATPECAGVACARAAGAAEPVGENAEATTPGDGGPNTVQQATIAEAGAQGIEQVLTGTFGAATAQTSGVPFATGTADGMAADVTLTQSIVGQLPTRVTDGIEEGLDEIVTALEPIADADPTGAIGVLSAVMGELGDDLASGPLARIHGGNSTSTTTFENRRVSATATAAGAVVVLVPTPTSTALLPQGLAVIEVGPSRASSSADGTNRATTDASGSVARITVLPGVLDDLPGLDPDLIDELPLDDILDLLPPEVTELLPIEDLLELAGASAGAVQQDPAADEAPAEEAEDTAGDDGDADGAGDTTVDAGGDATGDAADGATGDAAGDAGEATGETADGATGDAGENPPAGAADGATGDATGDETGEAAGEDAADEAESGTYAAGEDDDEDGTDTAPLEGMIGQFMQADEDSGGFVIDLTTGTERTCILEDTPLETCVTLGGTSETFTADGLGVGVLAAGVDISAIRGADTDTTAGPGLIEMAVGRSEAGVAAAFVRASTPTPTTPTRPLPQTGGQASFVIPSLALMALSGATLATMRRRRVI